MDTLIFVVGFGLGIATLPVVGWSALGPVNKAAGALNAPTRFQLADALWLLVLLQAMLAFCIEAIGVELRAFVPACFFFALVVVALWVAGVGVLSRAGVVNTWKRGCLLLLALPGTLFLMFGLAISIIAVFASNTRYYREHLHGDWMPNGQLLPLLVANFMVVICLGFVLRRLSIWIAGDFIAAAGRPKYEHWRCDAKELVTTLADDEVEEWHHEYVGAEHLFLALAKHGDNVATQILKRLGVLDQVVIQHNDYMRLGPEDIVIQGKPPRTPRAKRVLQLAEEEARNHPTSEQGDVGSEHLLLGLYREEETVAGQFLRQVGVTYEAICERLPSDAC